MKREAAVFLGSRSASCQGVLARSCSPLAGTALVAALGLLASCMAAPGVPADSAVRPAPGSAGASPTVLVRPAGLLEFPGANNPKRDHFGETDSNSPAHWDGDTFYIFNSAGHPWRSKGRDISNLTECSVSIRFDNQANGGRWFECTWKDEDGTLYGWYHNEPGGICPEAAPKKNLTAPRIGAALSRDNGATWKDLGIILEAPAGQLRCDTENFYFAGGNGDFSAMADPKKEQIYFFISTYGDVAEQGVAVARMEYEARNNPVGKVWKWHQGQWKEPGIGGHLTPIFPVKVDWHRKDVDAFWGPSIHYNTHLGLYVILLNRAQDWRWAQEGVYVTFNQDLSNPAGWSEPRKILGREDLLGKLRNKSIWYPQVLGLDKAERETDKLAGKTARLFVHGESPWEVVFLKPGEKG